MKKLLVVEDDPAILIGLRALLISEDFEVISTSDGKEGEELALSEIPDLVLLDINLPNLSGLEICRKLREKNFSNPIFMLTSRNEQLDKIIGLEMGADDYITKPFDNREVISRIRAHLRSKERERKLSVEHLNSYKRRLLTILFSDIVGYSRNMHTNEKLTLKVLEKHNELMKKIINTYNGKIIEIIGDAVLASFESAVEAVECAVKIQNQFTDYNSAKMKNERIIVRIGLHLGDVFEKENNLKGDTINIAARIQQNGRPGKVYLSEQVYTTVKNKTAYKFYKVGAFDFKNISEPIVLYSVR